VSGLSSPSSEIWLAGQCSRGLVGALTLSVAGISATLARARFAFLLKNALAFLFMSFHFVPFFAVVIPLYLLYQRVGLCDTHTGLILAYQLIALPFTVRTPDHASVRSPGSFAAPTVCATDFEDSAKKPQKRRTRRCGF